MWAWRTGLDAGKTPYAIAQELGRPPKTVMREVRGRAVATDKGAVGRVSNRCAHRYECTRRDACRACCQRRGVNVTEAELLGFDKLLHRLTKNGQSVHAAAVNNPELFTVSEKTLYRYIDGGLLSTKNGDLPRKARSLQDGIGLRG